MATFELDAQELDELQQKMEEYGEGAARQINDVLHGEGAKEINDQIMRILPASGRHWKGKKAPASAARAIRGVCTRPATSTTTAQ